MKKLLACCSRHWIATSILAAGVLASTGLGVGFVGDDAYHLLILQGEDTPGGPNSLYTFATGDPEVTIPFIERGPYPWWTLPGLKVVFFRPLSTSLHRVDNALFGRIAVFWHVHALLWYLAMVLGCALIFRRTLSIPIAALATIIFAIDDVHWMPAVWLANRNALIACVPALFGLLAHIRWRESQWTPGAYLSVVGYVVGMLGGEAWLGIAAYVAAYELFGRNESFATRLRCLLPAAGCAIVYAIAYKVFGLGVYGSGSYLQPLSADYFKEAPARALAMLGGLLLTAPTDLWVLIDNGRWALVASGVVGIVLFAWLLHGAWASTSPRDQITIRWTVSGAFMSLLPVIAAFPMNRLLLAPSLGFSVVAAIVIHHWWKGMCPGKIPRVVSAIIAVTIFVIAPIAWPIQSAIVMTLGRLGDRAYQQAEIDDTRVARQDVVLIAANDPMTLMYPPILRRIAGRPMPGSWHTLSASTGEHVLRRTGANSFELESLAEPLVYGAFADILRAPEFPFHTGDKVQIRNATITVLETVNERPQRIGVEFNKPLEDESLLFLEWRNFTLQRIQMPALGESIRLTYFN